MAIDDRRDGRDRRSTDRFPVDIAIEWETTGPRIAGAISDVSFDGCFVLASGETIDGERVKIFIPLADGMKVEFTGVIANNVFEIGFGVKFDALSGPQRKVLFSLARDGEGS